MIGRPAGQRVAAILLGCLAGGAAVAAGLATPRAWPLAFVAAAPLLAAAELRGARVRLAAACLFAGPGVASSMALIFWNSPELPMSAWVQALFIAGYSAAMVGSALLFMGLTRRLLEEGAFAALVFAPLAWAAIEFVRAKAHVLVLFVGPWYLLGHTQAGSASPFVQCADLVGAYGVSSLVMLASVIVFLNAKGRLRRAPALLGFGVLAVALLYGVVRPGQLEPGRSMSVGVVQAAALGGPYTFNNYQPILDRYASLTRAAVNAGATLVVWPESSMPFPVRHFEPMHEWVVRLQQQTKTPLLAGGGDYDIDEKGGVSVAAQFLFDQQGAIVARHTKQRRIPIVERPAFEFGEARERKRGWLFGAQPPNLLRVGPATLTVMICFDAFFPEDVARATRAGANLVVHSANAEDFQGSPAARQFIRAYSLRAVETRRWIVHSDNLGMSCFISPRGEIQDLAPVELPAFRVGKVDLMDAKTIYAQFGDIFAAIAVVATVGRACAWRLARPRRRLALAGGLALLVALVGLAPAGADALSAGSVAAEEARPFQVSRLVTICEEASSRLDRLLALQKQGLVADAEVSEAEANLKLARINLREALLTRAWGLAPVLLENAVLSRTGDGRLRVVLRLRLLTDQLSPTPDFERALEMSGLDSSQLPKIGGVVSIRSQGRISGLPFSRWIQLASDGAPSNVDFELKGDATEVTVRLERLGSVQEWTVPLLADSSVGEVEISSPHPAQEGLLGATVSFDLSLHRRAARAESYELRLESPTQDIRHHFQEGDSRLSAIRFAESELSKGIKLVVDIPERVTSDITLGRELRLQVQARRNGEAVRGQGEVAGAVDLFLTPRGVGRLDVKSETLYVEVDRGERAGGRLIVRNTGSEPLRDVAVRGEEAFGWRLDVEPARIARLAPDEEVRVALSFAPPAGVEVGEHDFRVEASASSEQGPLPVVEKRFTVKVNRKVSGGLVIFMLGGLGLVVTGLVWLATRIARRGA